MRCGMHNYNVSYIIPENDIYFCPAVTEELRGNEIFCWFWPILGIKQRILCKWGLLYQNEIIFSQTCWKYSVVTAELCPPPAEDVLVSVAELQEVGGRGRGRGGRCLLAHGQRLQQGTALCGGGGGGGPQLVVEDVGRRGGGRARRGHPGNLSWNETFSETFTNTHRHLSSLFWPTK